MLPEMVSVALSSFVAPLTKSVIDTATPWITRSRSTNIIIQGEGNRINFEDLTTEQVRQLVERFSNPSPKSIRDVTSDAKTSVEHFDAASVEMRTVDSAVKGNDVHVEGVKADRDVNIKDIRVDSKQAKPDKTVSLKPLHSSSRISATDAITESGTIIVSPVFKLVFLTVVILTVASAIAATVLAFVGNGDQPNQQAMFDSMNTSWKLGLGAIFGLLGGKAT